MLEIKGLRSGYARGADILKGIDLNVTAGERVAIMGRNGMGKTLLAKTIMGLVKPSAGDIRLEGAPIGAMPAHKISNLGVAYVPQGREIFGDFTILENLRMGVIGKPKLGLEGLEKIYDWFPILRERQSQRAGTMSGGQMQQLAIARALIGRPKLLLLDEPSEGIQPNIVHEIAEKLSAISATEGLTVIVIEQNFEMVEILAERVAFLENGLITGESPTSRLVAEPELITQNMGL
ncbi:ABC transporter ATP-binding protein [Kaistia terrae]|uniref:ABC transporter ATP-binding protein n=1 Tax=Kaistia terrae TaxID=537017 RepID=A0ABW0PVD0_9HYPH|nr:ABC transporter ATP-binding protein [Kaistia terrae]MCX5579398.1 ABC transporter ATP-binding protein [Kaistia terrae]